MTTAASPSSTSRCRGPTPGRLRDVRTAESYTSDQFSQLQLTSTQLTGSQWVGPAVRAQAGGQDMYVGIYSWNSGSPQLMLFLRDNGSWDQLATATTPVLAPALL